MANNFMIRATILSVIAVSAFNTWLYETTSRQPAQERKQLELHIKNMYIDAGTNKRLEGRFFLRATFNDSFVFEFGKGENQQIQHGILQPLDYKLDINDAWAHNGQLPFKLELVSKEGFEKSLVKCEQMPQDIQGYNRTFQCFLPMQKQSFLTYRLGDKFNKPEEASKLAAK